MSLTYPPGPSLTRLANVSFPHRGRHGHPSEEMYVHPEGDNNNDGLTWGTAKRDVVSAYQAIVNGVIHIWDLAFWDDAHHDRGLWLCGSQDPMWNGGLGRPDLGWYPRKNTHFQGHGGYATAQMYGVQAQVQGGGGDRLKPSIWIAGGGGLLNFNNIHTPYADVSWRIGYTSDMAAVIDSAGHVFRYCSQHVSGAAGGGGKGPGIELGFTYWAYFDHCTFNAHQSATYYVSSATRSGSVATITTVTNPHYIEVNDTVHLAGFTPSGYNGLWTVTAVPAANQFVVTLAGDPGGDATVLGDVQPAKNYRRAAIASQPTRYDSTPGGNFAIATFNDCNWCGGGLYYAPGYSGGAGQLSFTGINVYEGWMGRSDTPMLLVRSPTIGGGILYPGIDRIYVEYMEMADAVVSAAIEVEGDGLGPGIVQTPGTWAKGPVTVFGRASSRQQSGISDGRFLGHVDRPGRMFSPGVVRFPNYANQNLSGGAWTSCAAPDGTNRAGRLTDRNEVTWYRAGHAFEVGEWVIAGCWRRFVSGTFSGQDVPLVGVTAGDGATRFSGGYYSGLGVASYFNPGGPTMFNDGGWEWHVDGRKVVVAGVGQELYYYAECGSGNVIEYFAPVFLFIPPSAGLDDDEVREIIRNLHTYPGSASAGQLPLLAGQSLHIPAGYIEGLEIAEPAAPADGRGRVFFQDAGGGKTKLMCRFPSGASVQLGVEP